MSLPHYAVTSPACEKFIVNLHIDKETNPIIKIINIIFVCLEISIHLDVLEQIIGLLI